jgi:hypothetical protein
MRKRARTVQDEEVAANFTDFTSAFDHNVLVCFICMEHLTLPIRQVS